MYVASNLKFSLWVTKIKGMQLGLGFLKKLEY